MTDREAMKLALEALGDIHPGNMTPMAEEYWGKAITALRQALDHVPGTTKMTEPDMGIDRGAWDDVPDATKWVDELRGGDEPWDTTDMAHRAGGLRPECNQHPDAPHGFNRESSHSLGRYVCDCEGWEPEQKPVAWWNPRYGKGEYAFADSSYPIDFGWDIPLYTAPPKREWQGLTDEDIAQGAKQSWVDKQAFESVAWWAEEKLKEKNT